MRNKPDSHIRQPGTPKARHVWLDRSDTVLEWMKHSPSIFQIPFDKDGRNAAQMKSRIRSRFSNHFKRKR